MKIVFRCGYTSMLLAIVLAVSCGKLAAQPASDQQNSLAANFPELLRLAEAKSQAKQWGEAASLWEKIVSINPVQVRFWNNLANTLYQAKNCRKAIPAYEKVLELRGGFPSAAAYNVACCYALLGEKEPALRWLEKSFDLGFRDLKNAQTDTDLESLRDDPRYQKLVGLVDTSRMSREEGWRYDLSLLAREVNECQLPRYRSKLHAERCAAVVRRRR